MWSELKTWVVNKCWSVLPLDKWKKRSQTFAFLLGLALLMSLIALILAVSMHSSYKSWAKNGAVVLVPQERIVQINGASYIPIKMV